MNRFWGTLLFFCLVVQTAVSEPLIDIGGSNLSLATQGYELNAYDKLLDPSLYEEVEKTTVVFSLDGMGSQFSESTTGNGVRAGGFLNLDAFSPVFILNYLTDSGSDSEEEKDNHDFTYTNYNSATGQYTSITESADYFDNRNVYHDLTSLIGLDIPGPVNAALKVGWVLNRMSSEAADYTNTYTNTAVPSIGSLSERGLLTETSFSLNSDQSGRENQVTLEPVVGMNFGALSLSASFGFGMYNSMGETLYSTTESEYNNAGGTSNTVLDNIVDTDKSGAFYYDSVSGTETACFSLDPEVLPSLLKRNELASDITAAYTLTGDMEIGMTGFFRLPLYSESITAVETVSTTGYDDSAAAVTSLSVVETTSSLQVLQDMELGGEASLKKRIPLAEGSSLYCGLSVSYAGDFYTDTRSQIRETATRTDGDYDGVYTSAGVDTDTVTLESGYESQTSIFSHTIGFSIPLAVSYSPVTSLTFHAGTSTDLSVTISEASYLSAGDSAYPYVEYTDNLESSNSYSVEQEDLSNYSDNPGGGASSSVDFDVTGSFGFSLRISENYSLDAIAMSSAAAMADNVFIQQFSLTGIYRK